MPSVAILYFSAQGHTQQLAQAVAEGAMSVAGTSVELLRIVGGDITAGRWKNPEILAKLNAADAIIFGTPTYMGGYAAQVKAAIDMFSEIWMKQGWKDKLAAAFTHSLGLSGDKLNTIQSLWINAMQHGMIWVGQGEPVTGSSTDKVNRLSCSSAVMAQSEWGQEKLYDSDLKTGLLLGVRVAEAAKRWVKP